MLTCSLLPSDSNVYIWRKDTGTLMEVLSGHEVGSVNAVAWNPSEDEPGMFASCSDDRTIRICKCRSFLSCPCLIRFV